MNKHKGKKLKKSSEKKYSLGEIARNKKILKEIMLKSQEEEGKAYKNSDQTIKFTKESLINEKDKKKNIISKKEKHKREVRSLLLLDSVLDQISDFTAKEKIADFSKVIKSINRLQNK